MVKIFGSSKSKGYVHYCTLPPKEDMLSDLISANHKLLRLLKKSCLISPNEYYRKIYKKSTVALEREQVYHLKYYYYIIHPFSSFRFYWELLMLFVYVIQLFVTPFYILIENYSIYKKLIFSFIFDFFSLGNIIVQFFTGYVDTETNRIIFDPTKIFLNYFKSLFFFDLFASLPIPLLLYRNDVELHLVRYSMYLNILNIFSFLSYADKIRMKRDLHFYYFRFFQAVLLYFLGLFWFTSAYATTILLRFEATSGIVSIYFYLNRINSLMLGEEKTAFTLHSPHVYVKYIVILYGFILRNTIVAYIIVICRNFYILQRKFKAIRIELNEFMRYKGLPPTLVRKINDFYTFKYGNRYYDIDEVWSSLPENYRSLTEKSMYSIWLTCNLFKSCSAQLLHALMPYIKTQIYIFNDIIYKYESKIDGVYFLKCGTVAFYDENGDEVFHLEEGAFFSDAALLLTEQLFHKYSAIAIEACEVFTLERNDFEKVMVTFPDQYDIIMNNLTNLDKYNSKRKFSVFSQISENESI